MRTVSERGDEIKRAPQVGRLATSPLPSRDSPTLHGRGRNQKWPKSGAGGYINPTIWGVPKHFGAWDKIRSPPQVSPVATSPPLSGGGGSPTLRSKGQNQKSPSRGQIGYITPTIEGVPNTSQRRTKSEVAHKWAWWLHHPCHGGGSPMLRSAGQNEKWAKSGRPNYITPAAWGGSPTLHNGGTKT